MSTNKRVTLKSLSRELGLHVSTVSRVLNGSPEEINSAASPETVQRIRSLAEKNNYYPNPHATSLRTQRSRTVGVLVPRLSDLVLATIYEGIDESATVNRIFSFVSNTHDSVLLQRELGEMALARHVDGLIIGDAHHGEENDFLNTLFKRDVPFVLVSRHASNYISVTCNDYLGGQLAAKHLIENKHSNVAVIAGEPFASTGLDRTAGFIDCYSSFGVDIPVSNIISSHFDTQAGYEAGMKILTAPKRPSAIFAVNDFLAIGLMGAARVLGLLPGRDIAIVGFNDTPLASQLPIPLSSIKSPMRDMGYQSMEILMRLINGGKAESLVLEPKLVIRDSSIARNE
ncbi:UNVERIFIED_CONTAM: substrate-binding domain-containing protein [Aeromonas hydrophila]